MYHGSIDKNCPYVGMEYINDQVKSVKLTKISLCDHDGVQDYTIDLLRKLTKTAK